MNSKNGRNYGFKSLSQSRRDAKEFIKLKISAFVTGQKKSLIVFMTYREKSATNSRIYQIQITPLKTCRENLVNDFKLFKSIKQE